MKLSHLWAAPEVNPINRKARSIPLLNPVNVYGRVFFFSWFGFMVAFWAWYAFPPLLTHTIKNNLNLTSAEVANSNIVSLCATLLVRLVAGPACDLLGPRYVFAGTLLIGAIPLGLAPLVHDAQGLYVSRFFIGILGGSFVPCQVWSTGFFDKNVVGTANALTGGWGNAGGGITYFIMPAVLDSFVARGYSEGVAWRITFVVPLIVTLATGAAMVLLCPDTPTGKWADRHLHAEQNLASHGVGVAASPSDEIVCVPGGVTDKAGSSGGTSLSGEAEKGRSKQPPAQAGHPGWDSEATISKEEMLETARGEVVQKPTWGMAVRVSTSPQTVFQVLTYVCSFGGELAINSVLGAYYAKNFPGLGQTTASNWAAMFGFLNLATRPLGGVVGDLLYRAAGRSLWAKKAWIVACGCATGALLVALGRVDPHDSLARLVGLVAAMAIFLEAGNGANFALIPHVHPEANGIVSGTTGAGGNLGGVVFAVIFRFVGGGTDYARGFWITGVVTIALNLVLCWVPPVPKGQVGGR
ncbi:nitrate transporter [Durotheca rogersii]|uniref:nitrate transporter n=1 Tax=Durotheca rogersii TaxID=419775 RepID=UPI00221EA241|nr:nitrate transporter [Durotheca rogersii]KAI5861718.1 nitrate transporter [Durotheca rogersii]